MHCVGQFRIQTIQPVQYGSLISESQVRAGKPIYLLSTGNRFSGTGYSAVTGRRNVVFNVTFSPFKNPTMTCLRISNPILFNCANFRMRTDLIILYSVTYLSYIVLRRPAILITNQWLTFDNRWIDFYCVLGLTGTGKIKDHIKCAG